MLYFLDVSADFPDLDMIPIEHRAAQDLMNAGAEARLYAAAEPQFTLILRPKAPQEDAPHILFYFTPNGIEHHGVYGTSVAAHQDGKKLRGVDFYHVLRAHQVA